MFLFLQNHVRSSVIFSGILFGGGGIFSSPEICTCIFLYMPAFSSSMFFSTKLWSFKISSSLSWVLLFTESCKISKSLLWLSVSFTSRIVLPAIVSPSSMTNFVSPRVSVLPSMAFELYVNSTLRDFCNSNNSPRESGRWCLIFASVLSIFCRRTA